MTFKPPVMDLLNKALDRRKSMRDQTNALRLVNGIGDHLEGLVLEQYDKHFSAQIFDVFWLKEKDQLRNFLEQRFPVDYLIVKDRTKSALSDPSMIKSDVLVEKASSSTVVQENGLLFSVDLNDTLNTGLFLDMRANRLLVSESCAGARVLNCFSYTCSFGVYARSRKAKEVINVDVSKKILEKGRHNYTLNHLEAQPNEFIRADATVYLEKAILKGNRFDVIILDPPSFARADGKVFSVEKNLAELVKKAAQCLNENGKMFVSTNFSGISHSRLEQYLKQTGMRLKNVTRHGQDKDFVGSDHSKESHLAALWIES